MPQPKDEDVERRAVELAHDDKLEWVKRPQQKGQSETPDGATNAERDVYRNEARAQLKREDETADD